MLKKAITGCCLIALPACVSTGPIGVTQDALPCWELMVASGLLEATPGAALPNNDTVGEIASFGLRQTGQLDKANADKAGAMRLGDVCNEHQRKALEQAQKRNKPWWRRIF